MSKELEVILESELLNDETKKAISEALETQKNQAVTEAKKELEIEYAEKLVKDKAEMAAKLPELVNEAVADELANLKEEIEYYKRLEIAYADKFNKFRDEYKAALASKVGELVESVVQHEVADLKESVIEAKQNLAGQRIFEAIKREAAEYGITVDEKALRDDLAKMKATLEESEKKVAELEREKITEGLLANLKGQKREIMASILEGVKTEKLEERYNEAVGKILKEEAAVKDEKIVIETVVESHDDLDDYVRLAGIK